MRRVFLILLLLAWLVEPSLALAQNQSFVQVQQKQAKLFQQILLDRAEVAKTKTALFTAKTKLQSNQASLKQAQFALAHAQKLAVTQTHLAHQALRFFQVNNVGNFLGVVLGASSFSDLISRMSIIQQVIHAEVQNLLQYQTTTQHLKSAQQQLHQEEMANQTAVRSLKKATFAATKALQRETFAYTHLSSAYKQAFNSFVTRWQKYALPLAGRLAQDLKKALLNPSMIGKVESNFFSNNATIVIEQKKLNAYLKTDPTLNHRLAVTINPTHTDLTGRADHHTLLIRGQYQRQNRYNIVYVIHSVQFDGITLRNQAASFLVRTLKFSVNLQGAQPTVLIRRLSFRSGEMRIHATLGF